MRVSRKYGIALVILAVAACGLWFAYAPEHWMRQVAFGTVKVDDRPVRADVYIGNPTQSEAEAIALIHVPGVGDYFLGFGDENYREASNHEFVRLLRGAWTFKSMREGHFTTPLPFRNLNKFRVLSHGHTVTVQF
jgi:hypothetical protein